MPAPRINYQRQLSGGAPVPTVARNDQASDALQSLGQSAMGAGAALDRNAERRRIQADAQTRADETAGEDVYQRWNQRQTERAAEFDQRAFGSLVPEELTKFKTGLSGDTGEDLVKDLSPGAKAAFEKRRDWQSGHWNTVIETKAGTRVKAFEADTAKVEIEDATRTAAYELAGGNDDGWTQQIGRAAEASKRFTAATGTPIDGSKLVAQSRVDAVKVLREAGDHESAVRVYEKYKGTFGQLEASALKAAEDSVTEVYSDRIVGQALSASRDPAGNIDDAAAREVIYNAAMPEALKDKAELKLRGEVSRDREVRNQIGALVNKKLEAAQLMGETSIKDYLEDPQTKQLMGRMLPDDRAAFNMKLVLGPNTSNPNTVLIMDKLASAPFGTPEYQQFIAQESMLGKLPLSREDRQSYAKRIEAAKNKSKADVDDRINKVALDMWTQEGVRALPRATPSNPELNDADKKKLAEFEEYRRVVREFVYDSGADPEKRDTIEQAAALAMTKVQLPSGGLLGGGTVDATLEQAIRTVPALRAPVAPAEIDAVLASSPGLTRMAARSRVYIERMAKLRATPAPTPQPSAIERISPEYPGAAQSHGVPAYMLGGVPAAQPGMP